MPSHQLSLARQAVVRWLLGIRRFWSSGRQTGNYPVVGVTSPPTPLRDNGVISIAGHWEGMNTSAKLIFLCGKMAAGKSTLAKDLAKRENAILLVQDEFLDALFPGEITGLPGFVKCSSRLRSALAPHVCAPLSR